jgi:hypothetical protein
VGLASDAEITRAHVEQISVDETRHAPHHLMSVSGVVINFGPTSNLIRCAASSSTGRQLWHAWLSWARAAIHVGSAEVPSAFGVQDQDGRFGKDLRRDTHPRTACPLCEISARTCLESGRLSVRSHDTFSVALVQADGRRAPQPSATPSRLLGILAFPAASSAAIAPRAKQGMQRAQPYLASQLAIGDLKQSWNAISSRHKRQPTGSPAFVRK